MATTRILARTGLPVGPVDVAMLAISLELCVSANFLTMAGVPYMSEGGSPVFKFHPGTILLCVAFGWHLLQAGPWRSLMRQRLIALFLAGMAACLLLSVCLTGLGNLIVLLDSFLPAGLVAGILASASKQQIGRLAGMIRTLLVINALVGLVEAVLRFNFIPLYLNDESYVPIDVDFRPTAFFDHPLTGGVMMMIGLALAPAKGLWRLPYYVLLCAALLAFGGRTAMAITAMAATFLVGYRIFVMMLRRDPAATRIIVAVLVILPVGVGVAAALLASGFGSRIISHLYWDQSAQVRLAQWQILGRLDWSQIILGTPRADLIAQLAPMHLDYGVEVIENFWLLIFVALGLIGFPFFALAMVCLMGWAWRYCNGRGRLLLLSVMVVASTSNSLGRKSVVLTVLMAALLCLPRLRMPRPTSHILFTPAFARFR